jgi:hypothetical protein
MPDLIIQGFNILCYYFFIYKNLEKIENEYISYYEFLHKNQIKKNTAHLNDNTSVALNKNFYFIKNYKALTENFINSIKIKYKEIYEEISQFINKSYDQYKETNYVTRIHLKKIPKIQKPSIQLINQEKRKKYKIINKGVKSSQE